MALASDYRHGSPTRNSIPPLLYITTSRFRPFVKCFTLARLTFRHQGYPRLDIEILAAALSALSVALSALRSLWNFPLGLVSVALYAWVFFRARLYSDMLLQGFFAATLVYGWFAWIRGRDSGGQIRVRRLPPHEAALGLALGVVLAIFTGMLMRSHTDAALPRLDAALMAASIVGTVWSARRQIENWPLWVIVDCIYVGEYLYKQLLVTAVLYSCFVALALFGWRHWWLALQSQRATADHER